MKRKVKGLLPRRKGNWSKTAVLCGSNFLENDFVLDSYPGSYLKKSSYKRKPFPSFSVFPCIFRTAKNLPRHNKIQHENGRLLLVVSKFFLLQFSSKETTTSQFLSRAKLLNFTMHMLRLPPQRGKKLQLLAKKKKIIKL